MRAGFHRFVATALFVGSAFVANPAAAADLGIMTSGPSAVGSCSEIVFTCENGRSYPLCPIAVSVVG